MLASLVILITVVGSISQVLPNIAAAFEQPVSSAGNAGCTTNNSTITPASQCSPSTGNLGPTPNLVGSNLVPDLSLPKTVTSNLDSLIGAGGVIQNSSQNLTLYNLAVSMRLLGGPLLHDELLGPGGRTLGSWSFWGVQANATGRLIPLIPISNKFTLLGTNSSGTEVLRTMRVASGLYSGDFEITYRATSAGPLKWDLVFVPQVSGQYQLKYSWLNLTRSSILQVNAKSFSTSYDSGNYTLGWNDIPKNFTVEPSLSSSMFSLTINLGTVSAGHEVKIDPTLASNVASSATAFTFQRKVFFDPQHGYYFAFFYNGISVVYSSSKDGNSWSAQQSMAPGWPGYWDAPNSQVAVLNVGQTVVVASGQKAVASCGPGNCSVGAHPYVFWAQGTISGTGTITWQPTQSFGGAVPTCSSNGNDACTITAGYRYVNIGLSSSGTSVFSYNYYEIHQKDASFCANVQDTFEVSNLYVNYGGNIIGLQAINGCTGPDYSNPAFADTNLDRSILIPADSNGKVRIIYQYRGTNSSPSLMTTWYDGSSTGPTDTLQSTVPDNDQFSAVADANYGNHLLYKMNDGTVMYAYRSSVSASWAYSPNLFGGTTSYPSITSDYSTNDVYALGIVPGGTTSSIVMRSRSLSQTWRDQSVVYPVTGRTSAQYLTSNVVSASATNSSQIAIIWTEGNGPYNAMFASIPINTVWSPYSSPTDPWNGNGLAPYGQYFANLGEFVSPSTGMLTVKQTDLSLSGRGLNLEITRVYAEPSSFLSGVHYNYEDYPWAPIGNGWQLNFPWMNNTSHPLYVHLWDGQGYRIPSSFWTGSTSTFENHQGEHFQLLRNSTGIFLFTKSGIVYNFDSSNKLTKVLDQIGNNITFAYDGSSHISAVTDTAGRIFLLCYNAGRVQTVYQTSGSCASPGSARSVLYSYTGASLASVTDPGGRITSYQYSAVSDTNISPWLLSRITYPTQSYSNYTYAPWVRGTQATSYRVSRQLVSSVSSSIRRFDYTYSQLTGGDSVSNSTVTAYDGSSGSLRLTGYTRYSYSFLGVTMNMSDASNRLLKGVQQRFGVNGEIPREINLVVALNSWYWSKNSPGSGWNNSPSYTQDSSWNIAPSVANETQPAPPWGPISGWQDTKAKWIWWNPDAATSSTTESVWFREVLSVTSPGTYSIEMTVDNSYTLYVDGLNIGSDSNWQTRKTYTIPNMGVGLHVIGIAAGNAGGPAGLLFSMGRTLGTDVSLRTDTSIGSYTNYYRYDLWGNQIYSRASVSPSANLSHEQFNTYYNTGLAPGFYAFQDTFSQENYTLTNEPWKVNNGTWTAQSGVIFRDPSFNNGGWTTESSNVSGQSQNTANGETDQLTATFTAGTPGYYRIVRAFSTAIDGNLYSNVVVRLRSTVAKNLLRVELRDGSTFFDPTDGNGDVWKQSTSWTTAVLKIQGHSNINLLKLGITSEFDTSISGAQSGYFDFAFIANDAPSAQYDMLGQYSGKYAGGAQEAVFAWSDVGKSDLSIQARIFITSKLVSADARVGLITHYPGSGNNKWALVVRNSTSGVKLSLLEEYVSWRAESSCDVKTMNWYTLNFTIRGVSATGWLSGPNGLYCSVSGSFGGGSLSTATGFGFYAGGYSALFDNINIATVYPYLASRSFSNSFIANGAPRQNIHSSVAGTAQLTNGTAASPAESYFSYYSWGGVNQSKQRYDPNPSSVQWLTASNVYDYYGNLNRTTDARGYLTYYTFSANYAYTYLTNQTRLDGVTKITGLYAYNFTTGNLQTVTDPKGNATNYQNDNLGRVKRIVYPLSAYVNYTYNDSANYVDIINENKTKTRQIYDGLGRQIVVDRFLNGASYSNETSRYNWQNNILNRTDAMGNVYRFAYDVLGRTVNATRPNGKSTLQFYNDLASWVRMADEDGNYRCNKTE